MSYEGPKHDQDSGPDWDGIGGRYSSLEVQEYENYLSILWRLLAFPIWLPILLRKKRVEQRRKAAFAEECFQAGIADPQKMALKWMETEPPKRVSDYLRLQNTFRRIVETRAGTR